MAKNFKPIPKKGDKDQIAVALKYEGVEDTSPEVIASGRGAVAEQILQIAFKEGVKVREDADLAEILGTLDIGDEIPVEAFAAVAEILTYVYKANNQELPGVDTPLKKAASEEKADELQNTNREKK